MNELIVAKTAGYCFGVTRAVRTACEAAKAHGTVYSLGELIHNSEAVEELRSKGVIPVNSPEEAQGCIVIRSHGVPRAACERIEKLGLECVDATCPYVARIHAIVDENSRESDVLVVGDRNHPEVIGITGFANGEVRVVSSTEEIEALANSDKIFGAKSLIVVAQTTFDMCKWTDLQKNIKKHYTNTKIFDTICRATYDRQHEAEELSKQCDAVIIVGGAHSSNTRKLADICAKHCTALFAENAEQLVSRHKDVIKRLLSSSNDVKIGITAGASTPAYIIKEVHRTMSEIIKDEAVDAEFMAALDQMERVRVYTGQRVKATVVAVNKTEAVVDIGTKHSGYIPAEELTADPSVSPEDAVKVGDVIDCVVTKINDAEGFVYLSKKQVDAQAGMEKIVKAKEENSTVEGTVTAVVKGGVIVTSKDGARVFVPASQSGVPRNGKLEDILKKEVGFKVIEVNEGRGRVVGSIKAAEREANDAVKAKFWEELEVGKKFVGEVKSMESYGVFVDLGGVDGMVHLTELTWNRVKHPKEVVNIGDKLEVTVKSYDPEKKRVSLTAKKPEDNPWTKFMNEFAVGDVIKVQVVSITPFGAFAQIIPGVDGLIHISQIALERVTNVAQVLSVGQIVEAKITEIDEEKSRVSLSIKALLEGGSDDADDDADEAPAEE
ncbi:MAG: bifunctional 4-hydroxy-3-methylbut-2-enyl diphosphate reductase/30S ribosomal protein S1 [Ruminiclostridium sp.]|nr:bifunctional 4-hydroxy-3-methylbut-2-enyl diphosphate reductase/30S ribosomal protein S1 [Ruminiclostridium sp.]